MDLMTPPGQVETKLGGHSARSAVRGIAGDPDFHLLAIGYGLLAMGLNLPNRGADPVLPPLRNLGGELLRRPGCVEHEYVAGKLVTKPGLLPLGVLPGSNGNR